VLTGVATGTQKGYFFPNGFSRFNGATRPAAVQTLLSVRSARVWTFRNLTLACPTRGLSD